MPIFSDTASGREVVDRWRLLVERRLNHLVELYQSGRWKLYYDESEFLKLVQEARALLKTWEGWSPPTAVQDQPVEVSIAQTVESIQAELLNETVALADDISTHSAEIAEHDLPDM